MYIAKMQELKNKLQRNIIQLYNYFAHFKTISVPTDHDDFNESHLNPYVFKKKRAELTVYKMGSFQFFFRILEQRLWACNCFPFLSISFFGIQYVTETLKHWVSVYWYSTLCSPLINEVKSKTNNFSVKSKDINISVSSSVLVIISNGFRFLLNSTRLQNKIAFEYSKCNLFVLKKTIKNEFQPHFDLFLVRF